MADMTWIEIEQASNDGAVVLLPTGVIEEHGPHMSTAVDINCSYLVSNEVKSRLSNQGIECLIAPPMYWGINVNTSAFPGSFSCRKETVINIIKDIVMCLKKWGFKTIYNINWHNDKTHLEAVLEATKKADKISGIRVFSIIDEFNVGRLGDIAQNINIIVNESGKGQPRHSNCLEIHAESSETSIMSYYFPQQLNHEMASKLTPTNIGREDMYDWICGGVKARKSLPKGYFGNPASFNTRLGKDIIEDYSKRIANVISNHLCNKNMS
jgi:creatinine amidohydrolase